MKIKIITGLTLDDLVTKVNHFFTEADKESWDLHGDVQKIGHYEYMQALKSYFEE